MSRDIATRVAQAASEHDCQSVGLWCRECIIALANAVYNSGRHPALDGQTPSKTDAKRKLEAYVAAELPGSHSKEIREIVRSAFDLTNTVQHRQSATHTGGKPPAASHLTRSLFTKILGRIGFP